MLTREGILGAKDVQRASVEVPEWGGTVWVRTLTCAEWQWLEGKAKDPNWAGHFLAVTVCDENGARLFRDEDAEALKDRNAVVVNRLVDAAMVLNELKGAQQGNG